jgi:hypothetical protein
MNNRRLLTVLTLLISIILISCTSKTPTPEGVVGQPPSESDRSTSQDSTGVDLINISVGKPQKLPDDLPEHLMYGGIGGAGISGCVDISDVESILDIQDYYIELGEANWCFCGLDEPVDQLVSADLTFPNGSVKKLEQTIYFQGEFNAGNCVNFAYKFPANTEQKPHSFETELSEHHISENFIPFVDVYPFYGWASNERVRILVFDLHEVPITFLAEERTQANESGDLLVKLLGTTSDPHIVVIGESSICMEVGVISRRGQLGCGRIFDLETGVWMDEWLKFNP